MWKHATTEWLGGRTVQPPFDCVPSLPWSSIFPSFSGGRALGCRESTRLKGAERHNIYPEQHHTMSNLFLNEIRERRHSLRAAETIVRSDCVVQASGSSLPAHHPHGRIDPRDLIKQSEILRPAITVVKDKIVISNTAARAVPQNETTVRMDTRWEECHGFAGDPSWKKPKMALECHAEARPGYQSKAAHEFLDDEDVLLAKVKLLANMITASKHFLLYTGAGISTSSGIDDYASIGHDSLAKKYVGTKLRSPLLAKPTPSHFALAAMHKNGYLKRWIQQNHDGLPQKAGYPQEDLNEIHGAWYDPSNPVVMMSGNLRSDLFEDMLAWEQTVDLCLAMGTSMCGMNSDRVFTTVSQKAKAGHAGSLGGVIVNLQCTQFDDLAALRIFAPIDEVMQMLLQQLQIDAPNAVEYTPTIFNDTNVQDLFSIPYGSNGEKAGTLAMLDLREGAMVRLTCGPYKGDEGEIVGKNAEGHYRIRFRHALKKGKTLKMPFERILGNWWVTSLTAGRSAYAPVVQASLTQEPER